MVVLHVDGKRTCIQFVNDRMIKGVQRYQVEFDVVTTQFNEGTVLTVYR